MPWALPWTTSSRERTRTPGEGPRISSGPAGHDTGWPRTWRKTDDTPEGALDPVAATLTLVCAAVEAGARLVEGSEVQGVASTDGRVSGVVLPSGTIEADIVVLAAGTNSRNYQREQTDMFQVL